MLSKKIVVFGCDNTGKTTLCEGLKWWFREDNQKVEIAKSIGANKTVEQYIAFMKDNLSKKHVVIFDRFPLIEEATCGKVLRDNNIFEQWKWNQEDIDVILKSVDCFIYCFPGLFDVLNWGEREQMAGVKDNALELIHAYNSMAVGLRDLGLKVIEYNYNLEQIENVYRRL